MKLLFLLSIPAISAFIGWLTNYFAIKMLFYPREPVNLVFFKLQGIFPKRQRALARQLGDVIARELLKIDDIVAAIANNTELNDELQRTTEAYIDDFIENRLLAKIPMAKMFINDAMITSLKTSFFADWEQFMANIKTTLVTRLEKDLNIKRLIQEKVQGFSSDKLEEIMMAILKKEFRFVELIGAVLGFLIGCLQLVIANFYTML